MHELLMVLYFALSPLGWHPGSALPGAAAYEAGTAGIAGMASTGRLPRDWTTRSKHWWPAPCAQDMPGESIKASPVFAVSVLKSAHTR